MIKVLVKFTLDDSWDDYMDPEILPEDLLQDLLTTLSDQRTSDKEIASITIISKELIKKEPIK